MANPNLLSPNSRTAAEAAWERAQEKREAWPFGSSATYQSLGTVSLHTLDAAVATARERGAAGFDGLNGITNSEIRELFKRDLEDYKTIFAGAGIDMPTPAELAQGGIDFRHLAELKETLPEYDLVVAPLTLPLDSVRQLISAVARDETVPNNPLRLAEKSNSARSDGLLLRIFAVDWDQAMASTAQNWRLATMDDEHRWTAFLLPNNDATWRDNPRCTRSVLEEKMTVPVVSYVTYQMHRIRQGIPPLDRKSSNIRSAVSSRYNEADVLTAFWDDSISSISINYCCVYADSSPNNVRLCPPIG
jgi:hypothetical protein